MPPAERRSQAGSPLRPGLLCGVFAGQQRVVTASADRTARVWNIAATGGVIAKLEGHSQGLFPAQVSRAACGDGQPGRNGTRVALPGGLSPNWKGHTDWVRTAEFFPDGRWLPAMTKRRECGIASVECGCQRWRDR